MLTRTYKKLVWCVCTILSALKSLVKRMIDDAQNCVTAKNYLWTNFSFELVIFTYITATPQLLYATHQVVCVLNVQENARKQFGCIHWDETERMTNTSNTFLSTIKVWNCFIFPGKGNKTENKMPIKQLITSIIDNNNHGDSSASIQVERPKAFGLLHKDR